MQSFYFMLKSSLFIHSLTCQAFLLKSVKPSSLCPFIPQVCQAFLVKHFWSSLSSHSGQVCQAFLVKSVKPFWSSLSILFKSVNTYSSLSPFVKSVLLRIGKKLFNRISLVSVYITVVGLMKLLIP